ncbi:MAG: hypothetical protein V1855_00830 [bacterium]
MNILKKITLFFFVLVPAHLLPSYSTHPITSTVQLFKDAPGYLDHLREEKRNEIMEIMFKLIQTGFFKNDYNGKLILDPAQKIDQNEFLYLIEQLEKNTSEEGKLFLNVLNEYYHLCLFQFILSHLNISKKLAVAMNTYYDELYDKTSDKDKKIYPFRTSLSKIVLMVSTIINSENSYRVKQENLVYFLSQIKKEMLQINESLNKKHRIDKQYIIKFFEALELHSLQIPIVQPKNIKRKLLILGTIILIAVIAYVLFNKNIKTKLVKNLSDFWNNISKKADEFTYGLTSGFLRAIHEHTSRLAYIIGTKFPEQNNNDQGKKSLLSRVSFGYFG